MSPFFVVQPAGAKSKVPPRKSACQKFAKSKQPDEIWQALSVLSAAGYEAFDSLTQHYAENPVADTSKIGAWCRSRYPRDRVIRHAAFVPPVNDPTMSTEEYDQISEDMTLAHVQIIVGSAGTAGPPCPSSPLSGLIGADGSPSPCFWWAGTVPDSYGGVYLDAGRVTNKYGIKI